MGIVMTSVKTVWASKIPCQDNLDLVNGGYSTITDVGAPSRVLPKRVKDLFQHVRLDAGFPLLYPGEAIIITLIFIWKGGFQAESQGKRFLFLIHGLPHGVAKRSQAPL